MTLNEIMSTAVNFMLNFAIIIAIAAVIYMIVWIAVFFPIIKLRKHKQKVFEAEKKYNKIEVEYATTQRLREATDEKLRKLLYVLSQKELKEKELDDSIALKQKELAELNKKK